MKASTLITIHLVIATLPVTSYAVDIGASAGIGERAAVTEVSHEMGEHPAVLVNRNWGKRGYDYASKFYLHPARLALESVPPREMKDHPAVVVAGTWTMGEYEDVSGIAPHPALPKTAATSASPTPELDRLTGAIANAASRH